MFRTLGLLTLFGTCLVIRVPLARRSPSDGIEFPESLPADYLGSSWGAQKRLDKRDCHFQTVEESILGNYPRGKVPRGP